MEQSSFDYKKVYRAASLATRHVCPADQVNWREDITQEVVVAIWQLRQRGIIVGRRIYRRLAIRATEQICGSKRNPGSLGYRRPELVDNESLARLYWHDGRDITPLTAILVSRLEKRWETLPKRQKAGIISIMTGKTSLEIVEDLGLLQNETDPAHSICEARRIALRKLDCREGTWSREDGSLLPRQSSRLPKNVRRRVRRRARVLAGLPRGN